MTVLIATLPVTNKMKKKVLFIDSDPGFSGSTVSMNFLIKAFIRDGYEIGVVTCKQPFDIDEFEINGIKAILIKNNLYLHLHFTNRFTIFSFKGIYFILQLVFRLIKGIIIAINILRKTKPDLVYVNEYVLLQFAIAARILGIPSVTHIRSLFLKGTFGIRKKLLSFLLLMCNEKVFAITNQEAQQITKYIMDKQNKIVVIPEFLNNDNFNMNYDINQTKLSLGIEETRSVLLMLGGIEKVKGTLELIKAINILKHEFTNFILIIAGTFNQYPSNLQYWEECSNFIKINDLQNHIKILSSIKEPNKLIAIADIIISSSSLSHFSRPIIEGWAKKKAIVASDSTHTREYVEDGINGLLYKIGSPEELKEKIKMILLDKQLGQRIANEGYKKALLLFNGDVNTKVIVEKCNNILSCKRN